MTKERASKLTSSLLQTWIELKALEQQNKNFSRLEKKVGWFYLQDLEEKTANNINQKRNLFETLMNNIYEANPSCYYKVKRIFNDMRSIRKMDIEYRKQIFSDIVTALMEGQSDD